MKDKDRISAADLDKEMGIVEVVETIADLGRATYNVCSTERILSDDFDITAAYKKIRGFYMDFLRYQLALKNMNQTFYNKKSNVQTLKDHINLEANRNELEN
jgi:hypothetical protein